MFANMQPKRSFLIALVIAAFAIGAEEMSPGDTPQCGAGLQVLFFSMDQSLDSLVHAGFGPELAKDLKPQIEEIGYCLYSAADIEPFRMDSSYSDNYVLHTAVRETPDGPVITTGLVRLSQFDPRTVDLALSHSLAEVAIREGEPETLRRVAVTKIVENLRMSYVCHLRIESQPDSVQLVTAGGLRAVAPVEWIVPLGTVEVTAKREEYMPYSRRIHLDKPGYHKVYIELEKRRFYHSRLIYPTLACLVAGGVFYGLERYYYDSYQSLGEQDYHSRPDEFGERFNRAKTFERLAIGCMGVAGLTFILSFRF